MDIISWKPKKLINKALKKYKTTEEKQGQSGMYRKKKLIELVIAVLIILFLRDLTGIGCPIKFATGISCPGCGMSRALLAAVHLEFEKAFYFHPLFFLVPSGGIFFLFQNKLSKRSVHIFWGIVTALFLVVYIIRLLFFQNEVIVCQPDQSIFFRTGKEIFKWLRKEVFGNI